MREDFESAGTPLQDLISDATGNEAFWESRPVWRAEVGRALVEREHVVWSNTGFFGLDPVAAAVAEHLDGTVTLGDLASDLAIVAEAPLTWARSQVATLAVELVSLRAIEGVAIPEVPEPQFGSAVRLPPVGPGERALGESVEIEPGSGGEIRVVTTINADGNLMTVEYLPDGRVRTSTTVAVSAPPRERGQVGEPSDAELVPLDSCMGSKLRNLESVPLVSIDIGHGIIVSVRCHSTEVAGILRVQAGDRLTSRRGPIEAFVVTPLDGDGPVRVYDGLGRRRGRPRTPHETAAVVDQILGERLAHLGRGSESPPPTDLLGLVLLSGPDGTSALVPLDALEDRKTVSALRRAGVSLSWAPARLGPGDVVSAPSALGRPVVVAHAPQVVVPHGAELLAAQRVHALFGDQAGDRRDRQRVLERVARLASCLRWRSLETSPGDQLVSLLTGDRDASGDGGGSRTQAPPWHQSS